jgi:O-antigen/teichoic acid export membrane protein
MQAAERVRALARRHGFFALKSVNLAVITVYSFALIYVLVRVLSQPVYPFAVLVSSLGVYIMATDLGYSGYVYFRTRQSYLQTGKPYGAEAEVFVLYGAIALAAAAVMAGVLALLPHIPPATRISLSLYFLSIVLALPWGLLRRIAAALDLFLEFELFEAARRLFFLVVAVAMLRGLPFTGFCLICLAAWAGAFFLAIRLLHRQRGVVLLRSSAGRIVRHLRGSYRNIWHSGSLTLIEFVIYNFPYVLIPVLFADRSYLIAFDIFYKVVRFGAVSYGVPAESLLPPQTRAYYAGNRGKVVRLYGATLLIGLLPLAAALILILGFGDHVFTILLSRGGVVDGTVRLAMAVMLIAMLFQSAAGTFLVATGNYAQLCRLACITLVLMGGTVLATWGLGLGFQWFLTLYVGAYCAHAVFYSAYLPRFLAGGSAVPA